MASLNEVVLIGRMTKDPEVGAAGEKSFTKFCLAVDRKFKVNGESMTDFFNCVAWGKLGEIVAAYGAKGKLTCVAGSNYSRSWEDKDSGKRVTGWEVNANEVQFLDKKETAAPAAAATSDDVPF